MLNLILMTKNKHDLYSPVFQSSSPFQWSNPVNTDTRATPCNFSAPATRATPAGLFQLSTASSAIPSSTISDLPSVLEVQLYLLWHIWIYGGQYFGMFLKEPECNGLVYTLTDILLRVAENPLVVESLPGAFSTLHLIFWNPLGLTMLIL